MTIQQVLDKLDSTQYNTMPAEEKLRHLSDLDRTVAELMGRFEGTAADFSGYDQDTNPETELLIPPPHDQAYLYWLQSRVDFHNREYGHFNNSVAMFQAAYDTFEQWYLRSHIPNKPGEFH